jgi:uroporphyrinogen-III decarboxylase
MSTPRQIMKSILQGVVPERPLIVPIVFALGAKIENLSPSAYLDNPTKITNALRQIRTQLRTDGVSCYFDSYLELEALGVECHWDSTNQTRTIRPSENAEKGELPPGLRPAEDAAKIPRVKIAVDVIRRLNSLLRDEPLLMAGVSGPYTLAARLTQLDANEIRHGEKPSESALEVAASAITKIASAIVEAGANLIFIREEILPPLSAEECEAWRSLLAPAFNIIRFYEALPVVQLGHEAGATSNLAMIQQHQWDAVLCVPATADSSLESARTEISVLGLALPLALLQVEDSVPRIHSEITNRAPVLLTTDGDVPATTDLKRLMTTFSSIARRT